MVRSNIGPRAVATPDRPAETGSLRTGDGRHGTAEKSIWRNREFLLLWLAQAVSQTAQNAIWYGIVVLVQGRGHSSTLLSVAVLTLIIPSVIFGVLAGVYVDRWDKRTVLIGTNLIRGSIAFAYGLFGLYETLPLSLLFLINFLFSTVGQFFAPAETAMIPTVVARPKLLQANSLFHLTFTASQLGGLVVLGPLLVKVVGVQGLFFSMAAATPARARPSRASGTTSRTSGTSSCAIGSSRWRWSSGRSAPSSGSSWRRWCPASPSGC